MSRGHRSCTKRPCLCLLLSIQKIQMLKACVTELSLCPQSKMSGPHTEIFEMTWKLPELLKATPNQAQSRLGEEPRWVLPLPGRPSGPPRLEIPLLCAPTARCCGLPSPGWPPGARGCSINKAEGPNRAEPREASSVLRLRFDASHWPL